MRHQPDHMTGRRDYLDLAMINYNLAVDMTDSFHWNVKMIFLYLVAEYTNEDNTVNQVRITKLTRWEVRILGLGRGTGCRSLIIHIFRKNAWWRKTKS